MKLKKKWWKEVKFERKTGRLSEEEEVCVKMK